MKRGRGTFWTMAGTSGRSYLENDGRLRSVTAGLSSGGFRAHRLEWLTAGTAVTRAARMVAGAGPPPVGKGIKTWHEMGGC